MPHFFFQQRTHNFDLLLDLAQQRRGIGEFAAAADAFEFTAQLDDAGRADVAAALSAAVGGMSGPLHGGAPSRVLAMIEEIERTGDALGYVREVLDRGERLMGFGHRVYRAERKHQRCRGGNNPC